MGDGGSGADNAGGTAPALQVIVLVSVSFSFFFFFSVLFFFLHISQYMLFLYCPMSGDSPTLCTFYRMGPAACLASNNLDVWPTTPLANVRYILLFSLTGYGEGKWEYGWAVLHDVFSLCYRPTPVTHPVVTWEASNNQGLTNGSRGYTTMAVAVISFVSQT